MVPNEVRDDPVKLVIAILNWNGYELTRACVESLAKLTGPAHSILVIDNGSAEPEAERLAAESGGRIHAVTLPGNLGVGGGYNAGIRWAHDHGAKHVLLLNNDTLVRDPLLAQRLIDACGPDVFAVGPLVKEPGGRVWTAGGMLKWNTCWSGHLQADEIPTPESPYPVPWIDGSCMLVSVAAAYEIGGFDDVFFLYWEEVDACSRAWAHELRCLIEPRASIVHLVSQSAHPSQIDRLMLRNAILFMRRNGTLLQNATFLVHLFCWRIPYFVAKRVKHGGGLRQSLGMVVSSLAWNARDAVKRRGWRRKTGGSILDQA